MHSTHIHTFLLISKVPFHLSIIKVNHNHLCIFYHSLSTYHEKCGEISIHCHADLLQSAPALEAAVKNPAGAQIN